MYICFWVFSSSWKEMKKKRCEKREEKKMVHTLKWATAHLSIRQGVGALGAGALGARAMGERGAGSRYGRRRRVGLRGARRCDTVA